MRYICKIEFFDAGAGSAKLVLTTDKEEKIEFMLAGDFKIVDDLDDVKIRGLYRKPKEDDKSRPWTMDGKNHWKESLMRT